MSVFCTFICLVKGNFLFILFTIDNEDPFLKASFKKLLASTFLPLIAKKISLILISFEFIHALLNFMFFFILILVFSCIIFNLLSLNKNLLIIKIDSKISFLSEKNFFFPLYSCVFSCPFPAIMAMSPDLRSLIHLKIAFFYWKFLEDLYS